MTLKVEREFRDHLMLRRKDMISALHTRYLVPWEFQWFAESENKWGSMAVELIVSYFFGSTLLFLQEMLPFSESLSQVGDETVGEKLNMHVEPRCRSLGERMHWRMFRNDSKDLKCSCSVDTAQEVSSRRMICRHALLMSLSASSFLGSIPSIFGWFKL